jgi:hypothetical protein
VACRRVSGDVRRELGDLLVTVRGVSDDCERLRRGVLLAALVGGIRESVGEARSTAATATLVFRSSPDRIRAVGEDVAQL